MDIDAAEHRVQWTVGILRLFRVFAGFEFVLLPSRIHASATAANTNRWVAHQL